MLARCFQVDDNGAYLRFALAMPLGRHAQLKVGKGGVGVNYLFGTLSVFFLLLIFYLHVKSPTKTEYQVPNGLIKSDEIDSFSHYLRINFAWPLPFQLYFR